MNDCIFCGIAKEMEPSSNVHSDERVLAFMDTTPVNSGHVLVIPKAHSAQLVDLDPGRPPDV
jgi:diadenosine tetraphosphate (Ap4A) HIT family hydrolase